MANELIPVEPQEATDVCDMIEALIKQRGTLGDETLYRAVCGLVTDSMANGDASSEEQEYIVEFRSGGYFQGHDHENSGPRETAWVFATKEIAEKSMNRHPWMLAAGGMAVPR